MNFPEGEYSLPIVGDQWPFDEDLMALSHGKLNRGKIKTGFIHFADVLRNAQSGPLANHTATRPTISAMLSAKARNKRTK